jgi:hypothetical protein
VNGDGGGSGEAVVNEVEQNVYEKKELFR